MSDEHTPLERKALDAWTALAPPDGFADRVMARRAAVRSRRPFAIAAAVIGVLAAVVVGVLHVLPVRPPAGLAELVSATGPVERQHDSGSWESAPIGTRFYAGDAARTGDGEAELGVTGARLALSPHTVLRFSTRSTISVEVGSVELRGTGTFDLEVGRVRMAAGTVRIGTSRIELVIGTAQLALADGKTIDLDLGHAFSIDVGAIAVVPADAGFAPLAADAATADTVATIEVEGKRAEVLTAGATAWEPLPPGKSELAAGVTLRIGAATRAKLVGANALVKLPDGAIELGTGTDGPNEVGLVELGRGLEVTIVRGTAKLVAANGAELAMNRGERAVLAKDAILQVEAIPTFFDLRVVAGDPAFTVHDPRGATAIAFDFGGKCPTGGVVELDRDARFRTPHVSAGKDAANLLVRGGAWAYRLHCVHGGVDGPPVASGRVAVIRDSGRRPLPAKPAQNTIDLDGRAYRISYQSTIPTVVVRVPGHGALYRVHLATAGAEEVFEATTPTVTIPSAKLHEAAYTMWAEVGDAKSKLTTVKIDFDQTAAQVYIEAPVDAQPWPAELEVRGAVLPGWTASIDGVAIPIDTQRRFAAKVSRPAAKALAIKVVHPQRGTHYYLRRE